MFRIGETASEAVKAFAETGDTEGLDKQPEQMLADEKRLSVLDGFSAAPIEQGAGRSHAKLFVDGNHTLVSIT